MAGAGSGATRASDSDAAGATAGNRASGSTAVGIGGVGRTGGREAATIDDGVGAGCVRSEKRQPATTPNRTIETNTAERIVLKSDRASEDASVTSGSSLAASAFRWTGRTEPHRHFSIFCGTCRPHAGHTQRGIFSKYRLGATANTGAAAGPRRDGAFRRTRGGCDGMRPSWPPARTRPTDRADGRFRPRA